MYSVVLRSAAMVGKAVAMEVRSKADRTQEAKRLMKIKKKGRPGLNERGGGEIVISTISFEGGGLISMADFSEDCEYSLRWSLRHILEGKGREKERREVGRGEWIEANGD